MFGTTYDVTITNLGNINTSFFGNSIKWKLKVSRNGTDITNSYSYKTLKVRTGVQDPQDFTIVYTSITDNMTPIPMLGGKF